MISKYPGKYCSKKVADMSPEEHKQHRIHSNAYNKSKSPEQNKRDLDSQNRWRSKNTEKVLIYSKRWRDKNTTKVKVCSRDYYRRSSKNLTDVYIRNLVHISTGLQKNLITQEMINIHRSTLAIKRIIKTTREK